MTWGRGIGYLFLFDTQSTELSASNFYFLVEVAITFPQQQALQNVRRDRHLEGHG